MEDHLTFDINNYLDNDPICRILHDSYEKYGFDFKKEVKIRYIKNKNHKKVIDEVCKDYNEIIKEYFNSIS